MTVVVTSNVAARFRGFLASCMLEIAPGVYTSPKMTRGIRDRVWVVINDWFKNEPTGSIVMTWTDSTIASGQGVATLGLPAKELVNYDGIFLVRKE
ncbi:MAG: type I-E CRISPR-associated endoribonuclease Cas2 [Candidatus Riflebacteria bacterium HGW-Riflebacteria-1]|nr:MAG: type I-E CRISPR-associated endoribonuclease Cas2 [Candidatus Riflebacteria bacterium HGW-Riflebacteria-1]